MKEQIRMPRKVRFAFFLRRIAYRIRQVADRLDPAERPTHAIVFNGCNFRGNADEVRAIIEASRIAVRP